jgi:uncharacterized membrane protein
MSRWQIEAVSRHSVPDRWRRRDLTVALVLLVVAIAVVVGAILTWPTHRVQTSRLAGYHGLVISSTPTDCEPGSTGCVINVVVRLTSGPDRGSQTTLTFTRGATNPDLRVGEHVTLNRGGSGANIVYSFADIDRGIPILALTIVFILLAVVVGRRRGLAALAGLLFAGAVLVKYLIPALLTGESSITVSLVSGAAIALVAMPLAHGFSSRSATALLGSLCGMAIAALVSRFSLGALRFTGLSSDEATTLHVLNSHASVSDLLLCATVIGALGTLNDVTITQASAVVELAHAAPNRSRRQSIGSAMRIGQDHIASTVYSLVLAYAGAALPVLLLFELTAQPVTTVLTSDAVGPEVVSGLIGAIALILMVPVTTLIAALVATPGPSHRAPSVNAL